MSRFNTSQSKYVAGLGRNRCAIASITRQYNYLARTNQSPFCSLFDFNCQSNPASTSDSTNVPTTNSTVPGAPINLSAITGDTSIKITFTQPSDGGSPITNYEYSLNGGSSWMPLSPIDVTSPVTITGLTNGTVYNIKLRAVNSVGAGAASSQISIAPIPSNSFDPAKINGINLWLDGQYPSSVVISGNKVTTWNDKTVANNNFASSPTGTITYSQPSGINNRPAIYFETASSTYLSRTFNIAPGTNQISLFMVVNHVSNVSGNSELFYSQNGPTSPGYAYFDLFSNTNQSGLLSINIGNQTQVSTGLDIRGTISLIDVIATTSTATIYVNGTQTNNNISRGGLSLDNTITWAISGGAFKGYVGEIVTYPSGLSDSDRQKVEGYLAWKWGLQSNLPDSQPYKNAPPSSSTVITSFTTVGSTTWTVPTNVTSVEYLVVGGGGGSGGAFDNSGGGGGGGGMVLTGTITVVPGTTYDVVVGDGGAGGTSIRSPASETNGSSGGNSVFGIINAYITAYGGGGGNASRQYLGTGSSVSGTSASTGGSGGGGGKGGKGGGGNTSNGNNGVSTTGGNGGNGISISISGNAVTYGAGGRGADSGVTIGNAAVAGTSNTGNGARGGGVTSSAQTNGAKGGSGIIILKYTPV